MDRMKLTRQASIKPQSINEQERTVEVIFATEKPVIFIDTEPKVNNINWKKINLPCFEESIRTEIGKIVPENKIYTIPEIIRELTNNLKFWSYKISYLQHLS